MLPNTMLQPVERHGQNCAEVACQEYVHVAEAADSQPPLQRQVLLPVAVMPLFPRAEMVVLEVCDGVRLIPQHLNVPEVCAHIHVMAVAEQECENEFDWCP